MSPKDRWEFVARNESVTAYFYPADWTEESDAVLASLQPETRDAIINRLRHARQEPWRSFRARVAKIEQKSRHQERRMPPSGTDG
jgi:hypothetical protein